MIEIFKPNITEEAIENVSSVLRSGWIGLGAQTERFEQAFAEYVGAPYCVALNSCIAALHLAVRV
jgi:dTDP-4-amino-4,6-dideoxygalactose transaminase